MIPEKPQTNRERFLLILVGIGFGLLAAVLTLNATGVI